jgi:hypothetical protein
MSSQSVVSIADFRRQTSANSGTGAPQVALAGGHRAFVRDLSGAGGGRQTILRPGDLYKFAEEDAEISQAIRLLAECGLRLREAIAVSNNSDPIAVDEKIIQAKALLRQLFALRGLSEGFGLTINGCLWALKNKETDILSRKQITTMKDALAQVEKKPLLHFDTAMLLLDELEEAELNPEPEAMSELFGPGEENE